MNAANNNPRHDALDEAVRLLAQAMDRHAEERVLLDRVRRLLSATATRGGRGRGGWRYRLHFADKGVGPAVTLYRCDQRRDWEAVGRLDGVAAVFLQRLTKAARGRIPCLPFQDTAELLLGRVPGGKKPLPEIAHQAVRTAFYRKLPPGVDRRDLVRSTRVSALRGRPDQRPSRPPLAPAPFDHAGGAGVIRSDRTERERPSGPGDVEVRPFLGRHPAGIGAWR